MLSINTDILDSISSNAGQLVENKYVYTALVLLIILYGSLVAPSLPRGITKYLDNAFVRAAIFFIIAFLASKDRCVAILVTIAFVVTIQTINRNKLLENLEITPVPEMLAANSNEVISSAVPAHIMPTADNMLPVDQQAPANQVAPVPAETASNPNAAPAVAANPAVSADASVIVPVNTSNSSMATVAVVPNNNNSSQVVMDHNNNPVTDSSGKVVVAAPTVVTDKMGNPIVDNAGKAVLVAPKTAVDQAGNTATDKAGQVIVAPPQVVTDNAGNPKKDAQGNMLVQHCTVKVNEDNQIYMVNVDGKDFFTYERSNAYDVKNADNVMNRQVNEVCDGPNCFGGYNSKSYMDSNLCEGPNCYAGMENKEYASY